MATEIFNNTPLVCGGESKRPFSCRRSGKAIRPSPGLSHLTRADGRRLMQLRAPEAWVPRIGGQSKLEVPGTSPCARYCVLKLAKLTRLCGFVSRILPSARKGPLATKVPTEGLEPTHPCGYQILSLARLPIPPRRLLCREQIIFALC